MTTVHANQLDLQTVEVVEWQRKCGLHQQLQKSLSFVLMVDVHRMTTIPPCEKVQYSFLSLPKATKEVCYNFGSRILTMPVKQYQYVPTQYAINRFVLCNSLKTSALWRMMCVLWFSLWLNTDHLLKYQRSVASDGFPSASMSVVCLSFRWKTQYSCKWRRETPDGIRLHQTEYRGWTFIS